MLNGMKFDSFTLDNQIQVLSISDPRFVKSSAAMAVMSGSMQNPNKHLGLAHFLEHLLFLGTDAYPEVGDYENFLNKNGGGHNAYTSIDHTNYFFDVAHEGFEGALERFSRFFVCPTFDPKYVERERNAVNSEHEKNRQEDGRREYRFLQLITNPNHPFSKFATGDKETLKDADRDTVMDFYQKTYSANLMRLVLMSPKPSQEIRQLAQAHFGDIENKNLNFPEYDNQIFVPGHQPKYHEVESVRDRDILKLSFATEDDLAFWRSKPTSMLAHLIGDEGPGSLLSYLKKQGWALSLETSTWWRMFHVRVHLTEDGRRHQDEIVSAFYSYLEILKKEGLRDYIFNERKVLAEVELKNLEPKSSMSRASNFSAAMLYYPTDEFLERYYLYHEKNDAEFTQFLNYLNVDNMDLSFFRNQETKGETEDYYGINFTTQDVTEAQKNKWKQPEVIKELHYPNPNPYLPDNLQLVKPGHQSAPTVSDVGEFGKLYHQMDNELEIPRGSISLSFISDAIQRDPKRYLMARLFAKAKREELNEWGYNAKVAGLNYNISHGYNTMTVEVSGYSQHLVHLLKDLLLDDDNGRSIQRVHIDEKLFQRIKKEYKKSLLNKDHDAAYQQLLYEVGHFFSSASIHRIKLIDLIDSISLSEINSFADEFFKKVAVRGYAFGNIAEGVVQPIIDFYFNSFKASGFKDSEIATFENKFSKIPAGQNLIALSGTNNNNAHLSFYSFGDWAIEKQAKVDVLVKLIEQPYFTELRTHKQFGYVVAAFPSVSNGCVALATLIQTQAYQAHEALKSSDEFIMNYLSELAKNLKDEDISEIKASIIHELKQSPNSLSERLSRFMMMAGTYHGDFQFFQKLIDATQSVVADDLVAMIKSLIDQKTGMPQLSFVYQSKGAEELVAPEGFKIVQDSESWKSQLETHQPYKGR